MDANISPEQLADLQQQNKELQAQLEEHKSQLEILSGQNQELRASLVATSKTGNLPKEVKEDMQARLALGVNPDDALECAWRQFRHNNKLKLEAEQAAAEAKKKKKD